MGPVACFTKTVILDSLIHHIYPLTAFSRHWSVVLVSIAVMSTSWAITPLLGAVFAKSSTTRTIAVQATTTAEFLPLSDQEDRIDIGILSAAYGIVWLGQSLPPFTTAAGAFAPFKINSSPPSPSASISWTTQTDMCSTTLKCKPATMAPAVSPGFTFDDGEWCHTSGMEVFEGDSNYTALYVGYYDNPNTDWSLVQLGCPISALHTFLAVWARNNGSNTESVTAIFCRPEYWVQRVNVTVKVPDAVVTDVIPLETPSLLSDAVFNASAFEYIIDSGIGSKQSQADGPQLTLIDQTPRTLSMGIAQRTSNMIGFALGLSRLPPAQFLNPTNLATSFESAHKLVFALAASSIMTRNISSPGSRFATTNDSVSAIIVIRILVIVIEVFFGLVTILTLAILWISRSRSSQLKTDPASLVDILKMIEHPSASKMENSCRRSCCRDKTKAELKDGKILISAKRFDGEHIDEGNNTEGIKRSCSGQHLAEHRPESRLVRPREMTWTTAFIFISVLAVAIAALVILQIKARKGNGLTLQSKKSCCCAPDAQISPNRLCKASRTILDTTQSTSLYSQTLRRAP